MVPSASVVVVNMFMACSYSKPKADLAFNGEGLKSGGDYTLRYKANKNVGTAKVFVMGKGNFSGTKTVTFKTRLCKEGRLPIESKRLRFGWSR